MKELTHKNVAQMAEAALNAALDKAEELGYPRMAGVEGVLHAAEAIERADRIIEALGSETFDKFVDFLRSEAARETVSEAEDILRGEE